MISIIIPIYNQSKEIKKCLESIAAQTYDNYEIIVVNDRSTDRLSKVIAWSKKIFNLRIEWCHNSINHGAPYSRNKGFRKSKGELVLFCDADLIFTPDALGLMHKTLLQNPGASYAYPSHKFGHKLFRLFPFDPEKLKQMPYIHSTALLRREHFPASGWDEKLKRLQDWDIWLTMLEEGRFGVWIDQALFQIQGGGHTMSAWLPTLAYRIFPFLPRVRKYNEAVKIIKEKHRLPS